MNTKDARPLTVTETKILLKLLEADFPGRDQLFLQTQDITATDTGDSDNYGSIYLHTNVVNKADVVQRIPVEAEVADSDNMSINILLHVMDGYLNELEVFKSDGTSILGEIDTDHMKVIVNTGSA